MITPEQIENLVQDKIAGTELFLVGAKVSPGNKIVVLVDKFSGIGIDDCVEISRHIEGSLDREAEDFELQVSSPGLDAPFMVPQQYQKYVGKEVEVLTQKGNKIKGKLKQVEKEHIVLSFQEKKKLENSNKKALVESEISLYFEGKTPENTIKTTKIVISFK